MARKPLLLVLILAALSVSFTAAALMLIPDDEPATTPNQGPPALTEYIDFHCPYCAAFAATVLPRLQQRYFDSGLIRYEIKHFPFLPGSEEAAVASECARRQGKFQEYHDLLYRNVLDEREHDHQMLAEEAQLPDQDAFGQCLADRETWDTIQSQREEGRRAGVQGTPTLLLNGRILEWDSYPHLLEQLDAASGRKP